MPSNPTQIAHLPMKWVGPIKLCDASGTNDEVMVPLITYESPLCPSVGRGGLIQPKKLVVFLPHSLMIA